MKLYKQLITDESTISDFELLSEHDSINNAKKEAVVIANNDGCKDIMWTFTGNDEPPYELNVNDKYRLIIRDW